MDYRVKKMHDGWVYRRGDIYLANLNPRRGSVQGGIRPVLVLQNNDGNYYSPTLIISPLTSQLKKVELPTHYQLPRSRALTKPSIIMFEQLHTIDKRMVLGYLGKLTEQQYREIDDFLRVSLDIHIPESVEAP